MRKFVWFPAIWGKSQDVCETISVSNIFLPGHSLTSGQTVFLIRRDSVVLYVHMATFGVGSCLLGICPSYQKVLRKFSLEIGVPPSPLDTLCWHCYLVITNTSQSFQSNLSKAHLAYRTPSTYLFKPGNFDLVYLIQFQDISVQTCLRVWCEMVSKSSLSLPFSLMFATRLGSWLNKRPRKDLSNEQMPIIQGPIPGRRPCLVSPQEARL